MLQTDVNNQRSCGADFGERRAQPTIAAGNSGREFRTRRLRTMQRGPGRLSQFHRGGGRLHINALSNQIKGRRALCRAEAADCSERTVSAWSVLVEECERLEYFSHACKREQAGGSS